LTGQLSLVVLPDPADPLRFKSTPNAILIATDVAARGLDIPQVDHVVHFNLPRTADAYIHRSGRTARAKNEGFALQLCAPEERGIQRALMKSLGRGTLLVSYPVAELRDPNAAVDTELPDLPIEAGFLPPLRERIRLAREIEKAQHTAKKDTHDRSWLREAAEAMDVDIEPGMFSDDDLDPDMPFHRNDGDSHSHQPHKSQSQRGRGERGEAAVAALKAKLAHVLAQPLIARGVSAKYPTSGSIVIVDDLVWSAGHGTLLGAGTGKAYDDIATVKAKKVVKNKRKRV
jgi:ATP-dependent RNA helicase DDX24/MAK5